MRDFGETVQASSDFDQREEFAAIIDVLPNRDLVRLLKDNLERWILKQSNVLVPSSTDFASFTELTFQVRDDVDDVQSSENSDWISVSDQLKRWRTNLSRPSPLISAVSGSPFISSLRPSLTGPPMQASSPPTSVNSSASGSSHSALEFPDAYESLRITFIGACASTFLSETYRVQLLTQQYFLTADQGDNGRLLHDLFNAIAAELFPDEAARPNANNADNHVFDSSVASVRAVLSVGLDPNRGESYKRHATRHGHITSLQTLAECSILKRLDKFTQHSRFKVGEKLFPLVYG